MHDECIETLYKKTETKEKHEIEILIRAATPPDVVDKESSILVCPKHAIMSSKQLKLFLFLEIQLLGLMDGS